MAAEKSKKDIWEIIIILLFVAAPLISGVLFCLKDLKTLQDISIYVGGWTDEITYYKQIDGMVSHGMPRGFFGYNQSQAEYGPFAVWGVFPLIPYAIFGWLFGWNYQSPIYANILFCMLALLVFWRMVRPKKSRMLALLAVWVVYYFLNRYVLSAVVEALFVAVLICVCAGGMYLLSDSIRQNPDRVFTKKKDTLVLVGITAAIFYLSVCRPYYAVFFLIPLWKVLRDKSLVGCVLLPISALASLAVFFVNNQYFCSKYYANMLGLSAGGETSLFAKCMSNLEMVLKLMWYAIRYEDDRGWYFLFLFAGVGAMLLGCIIAKVKKKKASALFISATVCCVLIFLSLIVLYDVSARHILALNVLLAVLLIMEGNAVWGYVIAGFCVVSTVMIGDCDPLPYATKEYKAYMQDLEEVFAEHITVTEELSYDNVISMPTSDKMAEDKTPTGTYYGLLYAAPKGVGLSFDYPEFYEENDTMKAKYILCHPDGMVRLRLEEMGMKCIFESAEFVLYEK